jgi:hypothetical protein
LTTTLEWHGPADPDSPFRERNGTTVRHGVVLVGAEAGGQWNWTLRWEGVRLAHTALDTGTFRLDTSAFAAARAVHAGPFGQIDDAHLDVDLGGPGEMVLVTFNPVSYRPDGSMTEEEATATPPAGNVTAVDGATLVGWGTSAAGRWSFGVEHLEHASYRLPVVFGAAWHPADPCGALGQA